MKKTNKDQFMTKKQKRLFTSGIITGLVVGILLTYVGQNTIPFYTDIRNKIDAKTEQEWDSCMSQVLEKRDGDVQGSINECRRVLYN